MDIGTWINNFMVGKKKYSFAVLLPTIIGIIQSFVGTQDPQTADLLTRFVDQYGLTILTTVAGVIYATLEGVKDWQVAKVSVTAVTIPAAPATVPAGSAPAPTPPAQDPGSAPVTTAPAAPPVNLVKQRIESFVKVVSSDKGMWEYLKGAVSNRIKAAMQHMLDVNPNMPTIDAVKEVVDKYLGIKLSAQDCQVIQSVLGLPQVLHAYNDLTVIQSFEDAANAGTLGRYMIEILRQSAIRGATEDVVVDATKRVIDDDSPIADRRAALMEFGLPEDVARSAVFSGGQVWINYQGGYRIFNGYQLAGVEIEI